MIFENKLKNIIFYVALAITLTPLILASTGEFPYFLPDLMFPYITGKAFYFRVLVEILTVTWLIGAIFFKDFRPKRGWIFYAMSIFLLVVFVADWFGVNRIVSLWSNYERMEGFISLLHIFLLFIVLSSVFNRRDWNIFWIVSLVVSVLVSLQGFLQYFDSKDPNFRVDSFLGNPIYLAGYSLMMIYISGRFLLRTKENLWRILNSILILILTIIILLTQTRGTFLALILGLLIFGSFLIWKYRKEFWVKRYFIPIFGVVIVLLVLGFSLRGSDFIRKNTVLNRLFNIQIEGTVKARLDNWQIAVQGVKEKPVLGWGQNNYNYVFDKYYNIQMFGHEFSFDRTHNIFLDWLIAGGILALLAYLSLYVLFIYGIWKTDNNFSFLEKSLLTSFIFAYTLHNFSVFDHLVSYIVFFALLAEMHSYKEKRLCPKMIINKNIGNVISLLILILGIYSIYAINYPAYSANKKFIEAGELFKSDESGITPYYNEGLQKNLDLFNEALSIDNYGHAEIQEKLYSVFNELKQYDEASLAIIKQFSDLTESEIKKMIEADPQNARPKYFLGVFYVNNNRPTEAISILEEALKLSPKKYFIRDALALAYLNDGQVNKAESFSLETYKMYSQALQKPIPELWKTYALSLLKTDPKILEKEIEEAVRRREEVLVIYFMQSIIASRPDVIDNYYPLVYLYDSLNTDKYTIDLLNLIKKRFPNEAKNIDLMISQVEQGTPLFQTK
jgi:O-antigen ligase